MKDWLRWLIAGEWRAHPGRALVALLAIALGVALGFAIHLVNTAAFSEFSAAARSLSGSADLQLRARSASFDEALYAQVAALPEVAIASPVLELEVSTPGRRTPLKLVGIDGFQAAGIAPDLLGVPADGDAFASLRADTVFLSPSALDGLQLKAGDTLSLQSGTRQVRLRVAGTLLRARAGQSLAVMDIGSTQWQFDRIGQLSRIDLRLAEGADRQALKDLLERRYGNSLSVVDEDDQEQRTATLSRAYRVNLSVLAMVALFTGAFLVFSTQALSVLRRRPQFALLRTLGMTRRQLLAQVLAEGALLGVTGSAIGIALGYLLARGVLSMFGGDLGGGYFPGVKPSVHVEPVTAALYFIAGSGVALLGSLSPALEAARARPAAALKAGSEEVALAPLSSPWPALLVMASGGVLALLPPVAGLPVFGYLAIVLLLVGSIALMPRAAALVFAWLSQGSAAQVSVIRSLALARLANAPNQAAIALGGVLASFALMVAMAIMVASFRISVDDWLQQLLSADVYVRVASATGSSDSGRLKPAEQEAIASLPVVARAERTRWLSLSLDASRPSVMLIARSVNGGDPEQALPMVGTTLKDVSHPIWISEAMVDLYGWQLGQSVTLPLAGKALPFTVAGVWRDYARQTGSIQMQLQDYQTMTGDLDVNDLSLWLRRAEGTSADSDVTGDAAAPGATGSAGAAFRRQLQQLPFASSLEVIEPAEIRALSLTIFDRSFAVTYLLEAVAIVIGLFGVAATFSAQALARAKEFGMLRHLGISRRQILGMLAGEGALLAALAITVGFIVGWCISLILVFVVNPQSFHWTMQLHMPWTLLAIVAGALLLSAALTALASGRLAVAGSAVRAVREDW
jgi:putative ABC transport system permease protein